MPEKKQQKKSRSKQLVKLLTVVLTIISLLLIGLFIVQTFLGESSLTKFFQDYYKKNKILTYVLFLVSAPIINLLPGISSMFFISLGNLLFNDKTIKGMLLTFVLISLTVILTSNLMFLIGRIGGKRIVSWLIGPEELEKSKHLLTIAGKAGLPVMYLLPGFPDDSLALVAGLTDMSFLYNFVCTILFRLTGVFTITFLGSNFIPFQSFTIKEWCLFILICLLGGLTLLLLTWLYYRHLRIKEEGARYLLIQRLPVQRKARQFRKRMKEEKSQNLDESKKQMPECP